MKRHARIRGEKPSNSVRNGSVLMEFVIVLPIYLVLFGGVFLWGDIAVHATRLASVDRAAAFDRQHALGAFGYAGETMFSRSEVSDSGEKQDQLSVDMGDHWFVDSKVDYPWSLRAAAKVKDMYLLPAGGTAGRLAFAKKSFSSSADGVERLFEGSRIEMFSKDEHKDPGFTYNYYTLKRTRYPDSKWSDADPGNDKPPFTWRDNRREASHLVAHTKCRDAWNYQVYGELAHDYFSDDDDHNYRESPPGEPDRGFHAEYVRYSQFVEWSY